MKQELKDRFAQLGPIQGIARVRSGSPADVVLRVAGKLSDVKTIDAMIGLVRRNVELRVAKHAIEDMLLKGEAVVHVPTIENGAQFAADLKSSGVEIRQIDPPERADVKAIREMLGLTVAEFAMRYNLNKRTIEGWEQGRPIDDAANNYLHMIAAHPNLVGRTLEKAVD